MPTAQELTCSNRTEMDGPTMDQVSMIISTKNRERSLAGCLAAVCRINATDGFECIVVDNGSSDATREVWQKASREVAFPIRYVFEGRPGVGWALRAGLEVARGEIIACTDDDCYPHEEIVARVRDVFTDSRVGVAQGRVLLYDDKDARESLMESDERREYGPGSYVQVGDFIGANLVFRRRALQAAGGFDPLFGPGSIMGSGADIDAASRVILSGWSGVRAPELIVYHHHRRREQDMPALIRRYNIGRGAFLMKQWLMAPWRKRPWITAIFARDLLKARGPKKSYSILVGAARYLRHRRTGHAELLPAVQAEEGKLKV